MRLSYKWLSEYVDLSGITPEELAEKIGLPVDNFIETVDQYNEFCEQNLPASFKQLLIDRKFLDVKVESQRHSIRSHRWI